MPVSEIVAPALSTHQNEETFSYAKVDKVELKRSHLRLLPGQNYWAKIHEYYSLDELAAFLEQKCISDGVERPQYRRITFQFPDSLVCDSAAVTQVIQKKLGLGVDIEVEKCGCESESGACCGKNEAPIPNSDKTQRIWILADTSYSPCCVDEVAAEHVKSDLLVHFGDACLNPAASITSVYVFGRPELDLQEVAEKFRQRYPLDEFSASKIVVMADAPHTYLLSGLRDLLPEYSIVVADLDIKDPNANVLGYEPTPASSQDLRTMNRVFQNVETAEDSEDPDSALSSLELFHISKPEAPRLLQLTTKFQSVTLFDPESSKAIQGPYPNLMRRYRYMHMARSAGTIGILVNTLSLANTKKLVDGIGKKIKEEGKKHYVFVVGKPNVAKLANFDSIDMWCVLGCDHQGIILDQTSEYFKPIVTPYELLLALSDELTWTGKWVTDFNRILDDLGEEETPTEESQESENLENNQKSTTGADSDDEEPQFDAVTGRYVSNARPLRRLQHLQISLEEEQPEDDKSASGALVKKLPSAIAIRGTVSTSAAHLQNRQWTGLGSDWKDEDSEGAEVEEGRSGVARGYDFDRENHRE